MNIFNGLDLSDTEQAQIECRIDLDDFDLYEIPHFSVKFVEQEIAKVDSKPLYLINNQMLKYIDINVNLPKIGKLNISACNGLFAALSVDNTYYLGVNNDS